MTAAKTKETFGELSILFYFFKTWERRFDEQSRMKNNNYWTSFAERLSPVLVERASIRDWPGIGDCEAFRLLFPDAPVDLRSVSYVMVPSELRHLDRHEWLRAFRDALAQRGITELGTWWGLVNLHGEAYSIEVIVLAQPFEALLELSLTINASLFVKLLDPVLTPPPPPLTAEESFISRNDSEQREEVVRDLVAPAAGGLIGSYDEINGRPPTCFQCG